MDDRGLNDAAILLVSLGEEEAAEVFKHLTPKEVQKLGETIARMRGVTREKVDFVIDRFTSDAASQSLLVDDASDYVRSVLKRALGDDKAALLIDRIMQGGDISGIESLKWMDPLSVAELLRGEHPQIVAAILVHLEYEQAAAVLARLAPGGVLYFSNNFRKFALEDNLSERYAVEEISDKTIDPDFARNAKIHRAWKITAR